MRILYYNIIQNKTNPSFYGKYNFRHYLNFTIYLLERAN